MSLRAAHLPRRDNLIPSGWLPIVCLAVCAGLAGCTSFTPRPPSLPLLGLGKSSAPVGTPEWWDHHEQQAEFCPGKGYAVEGYDGYFDEKGRPIDRPVQRLALEEKPPSVGLVPGLDPKITYGRIKDAVGLGHDQQVAQELFAKGDDLFRQQRYGVAALKYNAAANRWPKSRLEQDALFMAAESHFFDDNYIKARDAYDALVKKHPNTPYLDRAIEREWAIARYWEQYHDYSPQWALTPNFFDGSRPWFDTVGQSVKTYDNIRLNDPTGPRADDALLATANIQFRRGRHNDADYHYTLLRREYPRSEHQFEAHLLGLQSKLRKYQGPDYDGTPLEEAKKLVKQLNISFAGRLSNEERERLQTVRAELNRQVALRSFRLAQYYDHTKHYQAARYYYAQLVDQYPRSELAGDARERLAQIADEPDEPPKRLAWFVDLFPASREKVRVARIPEVQARDSRLAEASSGNGENVGQAATDTTTR